MLVITSNRGLCGGYNASLLRKAVALVRTLEEPAEVSGPPRTVDLYLCGKKGIAYFRFLGRKPVARYTKFVDKPQFVEIEPIADQFIRQLHRPAKSTACTWSTCSSSRHRRRCRPTATAADAVAGSRGAAAAAPTADVQYDFYARPRSSSPSFCRKAY